MGLLKTADALIRLAVGAQFKVFCQHHGLSVVSAGGNRGGSLVWEAGKKDQLKRYISLGVTPITCAQMDPASRELEPIEFASQAHDMAQAALRQIGALPATYAAELWIVVESTDRYFGKRLHRWPYAVGMDLVDAAEKLPGRLDESWAQARAIVETELTEEYVVPRV